MMVHVKNLAEQLRMNKEDLCKLLKFICEAISDQNFIKQLLVINDHITVMSADN